MGYRLWVIGVSFLLMVGCTKLEKTPKEVAPLSVKTMVVSPQEGQVSSRYVGTIEPAHETPLSLQSTGRVVAIHAKNGQRVKKGQTIIEIDNTQAFNALQGAEASLRHAQDGYNRAKQVHEKGVVSDQKMVEIESQLAQAKSLYAVAKQCLDECTLTAPCDGVIDGLEVELGQSVLPGAHLCAILDVSGFSVRFTVPEAEIKRVTVSDHLLKGIVECAAVGVTFPIVITQKSVSANPLTHTYDVTARVEGGVDILLPGMVGKVTVNNNMSPITNDQSNIIIPARCILLKPEGHTVWVVEQGRAVRREIHIDGYRADGVRVTAGLQAGDSLIIDGYQKLYNGCKVINDF